jgi:hypothetical protein
LYIIFGIGILASALLTAGIELIITSMAALLHVAALTLSDQPMVFYCNLKEEEKTLLWQVMLFTVSSTISTTGGDW